MLEPSELPAVRRRRSKIVRVIGVDRYGYDEKVEAVFEDWLAICEATLSALPCHAVSLSRPKGG